MSDKVDKTVLEIDGARFDNLREFYDEISARLIQGAGELCFVVLDGFKHVLDALD